MARILIIYHRAPGGEWRSTYGSHLYSLRRFSGHECFYFNTARPKPPAYLESVGPDLVVFHYTFLALRLKPEVFREHLHRIDFTRDLRCAKALVPHDEQSHGDLLSALVRDFGVTHVFSPAQASEWPKIYREGVDFEEVAFRTVLTGYVDEADAMRLSARAASRDRPVDVGYRCGSTWPYFGRHGRMKREIADVFAKSAPRFGLSADISNRGADLLFGESWFDFLLQCKYTIGVEAGSSIVDYDGSIRLRTLAYLESNDEASFEAVEAACFPGLDGNFEYFMMGPRHLEAIMTKTCQVLVEGEYGGVLDPGKHYIELKRDFANIDEVLSLMKQDAIRGRIVERAYRDIILSERHSYRAFAELVCHETLGPQLTSGRPRPAAVPVPGLPILRNRLDEWWWMRVQDVKLSLAAGQEHARRMDDLARSRLRPVVSSVVGEERLQALLALVRRRGRRTRTDR